MKITDEKCKKTMRSTDEERKERLRGKQRYKKDFFYAMKRNLAARSSNFCLHPPGSSLHTCNSTTEGKTRKGICQLGGGNSDVRNHETGLPAKAGVTWR